MLEVIVLNQQEEMEFAETDLLERVAREVWQFEGSEGRAEVSIVLVDNDTIQKLNWTYRGIDAPTDVLSFPMDEAAEFQEQEEGPEGQSRLLGDIIISLPRAASQAQDYGHSFHREVAYLTVHGMLHLLGYDHHEEEERKLMRAKEEAVLSRLSLERN